MRQARFTVSTRRHAAIVTAFALLVAGFLIAQTGAQGLSPDLLKAVKFRAIGPTAQGGRFVDVAVPETEPWTIYMAAATGGLWKSVNNGTSWEPLFENQPVISIGDIAVAPSNAAIVWVGSGEHTSSRSTYWGDGVYKSTDAGKTWTNMGLKDTHHIGRVLVDPKDPNIVYVAALGHLYSDNAERGVFKTIDGGKTWAKALEVKADGRNVGACDLVMDSKNPKILYAAAYDKERLPWTFNLAGPGSGIYKTIDGGQTWKAINAGLPEPQSRGRIGLDLCLTKPNVLYALVDNYEISRQPTEEEKNDSYGLPSAGFIKGATVYRSDDRGATWTQVSGKTPEQKKFMERSSNTYGWVFSQIRVDPNDPNTVYTMGLGLNASTDGGKTFKELDTPGGDHHGLWIDPDNSNYLINVFDQGFAISYDRGKTWKDSHLVLPLAQFFNIAYDMATPFCVYGSVQDHGSFRGAVNLAEGRDKIPAVEFEEAPGGEGSSHAIDPLDANIVYSSGFYGTLTRSDMSKPRGERSKSLLPGRYPEEAPFRGEWVAPTIISPHSNQVIYHGMQHLLMSRDRGDTWEVISPDLTYNTASEKGDIPYHTIFAISESPLRFGLIYAGTDDGKVQVTKDGGKTWTEIMQGLPYQKWVSRIVASAFDIGTVYMTQNGKRDDDFTPYVWKSVDFGKTWTSIAAGIPIGPANVIREDPVDRNILYVGTDTGVYVTTDRGKTWAALGGNLPAAYVHDLIIHPRDNVIVIATHGRGMWAIDANPINKKAERRRGTN